MRVKSRTPDDAIIVARYQRYFFSNASNMLTHLGIYAMHVIARLPLPLIRAAGYALGRLIHFFAADRRRVVSTNIQLCFPQLSAAQQHAMVIATFVHVAQAWLDRSWLWHGTAMQTRSRLRVVGAVDELADPQPIVLFAPHFVGLDAGWTALTQQVPRPMSSIYTRQRNPTIDSWIFRGRKRFGNPQLFERREGARTIVSSLRSGQMLYLLPDMNFGPQESVFVPFYGIPTATLTSLSRFARAGRAKVIPVTTCMTRNGYDVRIHPAWPAFAGSDLVSDAALMNSRLQAYIDAMPDQYYWVHRRFKTRPAGSPPVY